MKRPDENLTKFRSQIDDIDDKIISLLKERMAIVKQVGKHKSQTSATQSFIRAGREASMLRNLSRKADSIFPPAAIASIWRTIISTSLCTEQNMSISAYATDKNHDCFWLAREYYGSFVKTHKTPSADEVIDNVSSGKTSIGILPIGDNSCTWWLRPENEQNDIFIFARIPFVEDKKQPVPSAVAIANVMPEATDDDVSVFVATGFSMQSDIEKTFAQIGTTAKIIASKDNSYLIEADNFIDKNSENLSILQKTVKSQQHIRLLGAYARPISI